MFNLGLELRFEILMIYGAYLLLISIVAFFMYLSDKQKAKKGKWRIPEKVLLLTSFLGGAFGSYPAMLIFRHKTTREHWYFTFVNILGLIVHITTIVLILLLVK